MRKRQRPAPCANGDIAGLLTTVAYGSILLAVGFTLTAECDTPGCETVVTVDVTRAIPRRRSSPLLLQFVQRPLIAKALAEALGVWWDIDVPAGLDIEHAHDNSDGEGRQVNGSYLVICAKCKAADEAATGAARIDALHLDT